MKNMIVKNILVAFLLLVSSCIFAKDLKLENEIEKLKVKVTLTELHASDQACRTEMMELQKKGYSFDELYNHSSFGPYWGKLDRKNVAELKRIIQQHGWPKASSYDLDTEEHAWVITQHADFDRPFQKKILQLLKKDPATNEQRKRNIALLEDRILVGENKPQVYGSQGKCAGSNQWKADPIKDQAHLNQRRAVMGLPSFQEYQTIVNKMCF